MSKIHLTINGQVLGKLPIEPLRLSEGIVVIEAKSPGHATKTLTLQVAGEKTEKLDLTLAPIALAVPPDPTNTPPGTGTPLPPPASTNSTYKWLGVGLIGAGAATLGLGITWLVMNGRQGTCSTGSCEYTTATQGWIATAVGAGIVAGGVVLVVKSSSSVKVSLAPTSNGLLAFGQF